MENSPRKLEIFESSASGFNYDGEAGKYAADRELRRHLWLTQARIACVVENTEYNEFSGIPR
jgi:hypothetical protein